MIIDRLKYIVPTWYFKINSSQSINPFPDVEELKSNYSTILQEPSVYQSEVMNEVDLVWQGFNKGVFTEEKGYDMWRKEELPAVDEYRFLRRYFSAVWINYVLLMQLITLKNPFKEVFAFWKSKDSQRINLVSNVNDQSSYHSFDSSLLESKPLISIIIPTLNRYKYLEDVFKDLERQDYKNFEVIVVDQSEPFKKSFYEGWNLNLQVTHQKEKALWLARNRAIKMAQGNFLLLYDDDSRIESDWIVQHLKTLDYFKADISSGVSISVVGGEIPNHYNFFRYSDQLDTGNVLIKREVFEQIGLFDRQFEKQRMGDGEFGLRAYLAGFKNISNPYAKRVHLKVSAGGLRQMGSWDAFRPKNFFSPRPIPSVLYLYRKYYGKRAAIYGLFKILPRSIIPYKYKKNQSLMLIGIMISVFLFPMLIVQVNRSWKLASEKLQRGAKIDSLD